MPVNRSEFTTRTPLDSIAFGLFVDSKQFVAKQLCNVLPFDKALKKIYQRDASERNLVETEKATNAEADIVDRDIFATNITTIENKLKVEINPRDQRDSDMPQLTDESAAVEYLEFKLEMRMEAKFFTIAGDPANYMAALTSALSSGSKWNEANGAPEADKLTVDEALRNTCGRKANALTIDELTLAKLKLSPEWRSRTQYTNAGPIPDDLIKAYFGVEFLFLSGARYNDAVKGAAQNLVKPLGDDVIFSVFDPKAGMRSQNAFVMGVLDSGFWNKTYEDPKKTGSAGSMRYVELGTEYAFGPGFVESKTSSKFAAAYLLRDVVA